MKFSDFDLDPRIQRGIAHTNYVICTPVQQQTLQHVLQKKDVMVQSQTGTGKTAAYLIPAFHLLLTQAHLNDRAVLVISPTRELAEQISAEATQLGTYSELQIATIIGGVEYKRQIEALQKGVHLIIGTPGRLIDHVRSKNINLRKIGIVIIDEADRMFDMGFYPEVATILRGLPPRRERLTMLLSATLSVSARNLAWRYMNHAVEIEIAPEQKTVKEIEQRIFHLAKDEKVSFLVRFLTRHKPSNALIFTNMRSRAEWLSKMLKANGLENHYISGALPQKRRSTLMGRLKEGQIRYLVATDVAARGLHIDDLALVVNYDLPEDAENYVHRIGRTARAGKGGLAISLACEQFVYGLAAIERYINVKIPVGDLQADDFAEELQRIHSHHNHSLHSRSSRRNHDSPPTKSTSLRTASGGRSSGAEGAKSEPRHQRSRPPSISTTDRPKGHPEKHNAAKTTSTPLQQHLTPLGRITRKLGGLVKKR